MRKQILFILLLIIGVRGIAQDSKIMEERAREMIRVISTNDRELWRKFIKENYTQALIDRSMKAKVSTSDTGTGNQSTETSAANNLEKKVDMFARLHQDFGGGKISSLTTKDDKVEMKVTGVGVMGTFNLRFEKSKPYRIDAIGIEAGN